MLTYNTCELLPDEQLVKLAQSGDSQAMDSIIMRYRSLVSAAASKYYMSGFDREDIIQEGMIGLYRAVLDYNPEKTAFKSFAGICVSRKIISLLKSAMRQKNIPLNTSISLNSAVPDNSDIYLIDSLKTAEHMNPETIVISRESYSRYTEVIRRVLSPFELRVLSCYIKKMPYRDISTFLGRDIKSIDNAVQRIKKKLEAVIVCDS